MWTLLEVHILFTTDCEMIRQKTLSKTKIKSEEDWKAEIRRKKKTNQQPNRNRMKGKWKDNANSKQITSSLQKTETNTNKYGEIEKSLKTEVMFLDLRYKLQRTFKLQRHNHIRKMSTLISLQIWAPAQFLKLSIEKNATIFMFKNCLWVLLCRV